MNIPFIFHRFSTASVDDVKQVQMTRWSCINKIKNALNNVTVDDESWIVTIF